MPETLRFIQPCSPMRAVKPPAGDGWIHEPKLDGYRLQIIKSGRTVRLYSRNGHDWGRRIPCMVEALQALPCQAAVIDAELVLQAEDGAPDFYSLPEAISARPHELTVFAFDLLHRDGMDLRPLPLSQRKDQLVRLVRRSKVHCLQLVAGFLDGTQLLATPSALSSRGSYRSGGPRPIAPGSAGIGARSRRPRGARRTGSGGGSLSEARPYGRHFAHATNS